MPRLLLTAFEPFDGSGLNASLVAVRAPGCEQQLIEAGGPAAYLSTLPVEPIAAAIAARGVPAEVSNHAGTYLCNHILYQSLHRTASRAEQRRIGFLHLPRLPDQLPPAERGAEAPCLPLSQLVAAIAAAVEAIVHRGALP